MVVPPQQLEVQEEKKQEATPPKKSAKVSTQRARELLFGNKQKKIQ